MATETSNPEEKVLKRAREEIREVENDGGGSDGVPKKKTHRQKGEKDGGEGGNSADEKLVRVGRCDYRSAREMYDHLNRSIQYWPLNIRTSSDTNWDGFSYFLDLVNKGHPDPEKLIGCGAQAFRLQTKPTCNHCRSLAMIRTDGSVELFCFKACIDNIFPLPEDLKEGESGRVPGCKIHGKPGEMVEVPNFPAMFDRLARGGGRSDSEEGVNLGPIKFITHGWMLLFFSARLSRSPLDTPLDGDLHLMLLDLLKKGDPEWETKIGSAGVVESFQVRTVDTRMDKPCRSFVVVREDGKVVEFCFRKCVDNILPLLQEQDLVVSPPPPLPPSTSDIPGFDDQAALSEKYARVIKEKQLKEWRNKWNLIGNE